MIAPQPTVRPSKPHKNHAVNPLQGVRKITRKASNSKPYKVMLLYINIGVEVLLFKRKINVKFGS